MQRTLNIFISISLFLTLQLAATIGQAADTPEIATATFTCAAQWDEHCSDEQTLPIPKGYKLCKHVIAAKEQTGNSFYNVTEVTDHSVSLHYEAKGNLDRYKPKNSYIEIHISLHGVRKNESCDPVPLPVVVEPAIPTPHACACTPLIEAEDANTCLAKGEQSFGKSCDSLHVTVSCVADKTTCREIHRKNCPSNASLDKSKSNKRLYIKNSPYCAR